jgi:hypothetical protein
MIGTSCRFCEFRVNDETGKQVGCELNLIAKYAEKYNSEDSHVETHTADDEHGQDEFTVLPTFCLFRRSPGWKEAKADKLEGKTYAEFARSELTIRTTAVLFLDAEQDMHQLLQSIKQIEQMSAKPVKLVIVNWSDKVRPHNFLALNKQTSMPWAMETVLESREDLPPEYYHGEDSIERRAYDIGVKKVETPFFFAARVGTNIDPDFVKNIEKEIIDDLNGVLMQEGEVSFYQTALYKMLGGNKERPVNLKIRDVAKEQECSHLIKTQE